jgi:hypothetical protein
MKSAQRSLGRISAIRLFPSGLPNSRTSQQIVTSFLNSTDSVAHRWIESRKGILVLAMVPFDSASGAIYLYDRQRDIWYMLSFEAMDSCFTLELFKEVSKEYRLHEYMIQPGLLLNLLDPDQRPAKAPEEPTEVVVPISVAA